MSTREDVEVAVFPDSRESFESANRLGPGGFIRLMNLA